MIKIDSIDREKAIQQLKAGICPYCGKGPFKLVLAHVSGDHKFKAANVKDYLLINRGRGFADDDTRMKLSGAMKERNELGVLQGRGHKKGKSNKPSAFESKRGGVPNTSLRKLSGLEVSEIRSLSALGESDSALSKKFNVSRIAIYFIKNNVTYKDEQTN